MGVALVVALAIAFGSPSAASSAVGFLSVGPVAGPAGIAQIVDPSGRDVLLKGINVDGLVDYFRPDLATSYPAAASSFKGTKCPPDDPTVEGVDVCHYDFTQLQPLGYDVIRLNISWSLLEPTPGHINQTYVARIAQVVDWAKRAGIYVVLDMHQDAWSKYVYTAPSETCAPPLEAIRGFDGAPSWASQHSTPACALHGTRELDTAVQEEFQKLYDDALAPDGVGLQEHYTAALAALARRFAGESTVAGYEIINEPSPRLRRRPRRGRRDRAVPLLREGHRARHQ